MGSTSAMDSLSRVIDQHGTELQAELMAEAKSPLVTGVELENNLYSVSVTWVLSDGTRLSGAPLDIDDLAERFPDCEVGY